MELHDLRKHTVDQGRSMVRVRYKEDGRLITAAVCPGCWNSPQQRQLLLKKMEKLGVEPVHKADLASGVYREKSHAPGCPLFGEQDRAWDKFTQTIIDGKRKKRF